MCIIACFFSFFGWNVLFFSFNKPNYKYFDDSKTTSESYWLRAKPSLPKYMTDRPRYIIFKTLFILFAIAEWFLIARLLPILPGVEKLINTDSHNNLLTCSGLALISALLLLGLVQYLEWPRKLLFDYVKDWFHQFACIPKQGRIVYNCLCFRSIDFDSPVTQKKHTINSEKQSSGKRCQSTQHFTN